MSLLTKKEETPIMKKNIIVRIILQNIVNRREGVGVAAANRYSFGRPDKQSELILWAAKQGIEAVACADPDEAVKCLQQSKDAALLCCSGVKEAEPSLAYQGLLRTAKTLETPILMVIASHEYAQRAFDWGADEVVVSCAPQAVLQSVSPVCFGRKS